MKQFIFILTFFFVVHTTFSYNPFWVRIDKKLIKNIVKLDKNSPKTVEQYFKTQKIQKCDTTKNSLGFGWAMWSPSVGGGYISISATFYYYNNNIVSYTITPEMPNEKRLIDRYKAWYQNSFTFDKETILPFIYKEEKILRPLKEYKGVLTTQMISPKILEYMTPNSGITYGYSGGYAAQLLSNRKTFIEIKNNLTNDQVIFLMYSINPASRLTAIEYYLQHKDNFSNYTELDEWVEINFKEIPEVHTLSGCILRKYDTRTLVLMYSTMVDR
ncbi:MAG: hypothetical protein EAZ85_14480 [Bacteroidetes bacterium]|nr:MAG: hypothetical protein EAZ85_14480 [Bacteroidota bacterium]TAG85936.1 MAG: hypothetical protein EAZ20_13870 [Bacteroidota bacterium]